MKHIFPKIGIVLVIIFTFCGCQDSETEYKWDLKTEAEAVSIFREQKDTLQAIADILTSYDNKFFPGAMAENDTKAWISSPYDTEKMNYFNEDERQIICDFIENTKPYMIVEYSKTHISFDYINEAQNGTYSIDYYTADVFDDALSILQNSDRELIEYTKDGWLLLR